jgi:hypothetical protein
MSHTFTKLLAYVIFRTKERRSAMCDPIIPIVLSTWGAR